MIRWIQRLLMGEHHRRELEKLRYYRSLAFEYEKYFSSMPDVQLVMKNLRAHVEGRLIVSDVPGHANTVPVHMEDLRNLVRELRMSCLGSTAEVIR